MLADECHKLIDENYPEPVLKVWTPSEWDLKYKFKSTSRGQAKLAQQKEKEDTKLKETYDKEVAAKRLIHDVIDEISTYPQEIASLFLNTFQWTIDDIVRKHEAHLNFKEELLKKYGESVAKNIRSLQYLIEERYYESSFYGRRGSYKTRVLADVSDEKWNQFINSNYGDYYKEFGKVKDRTELFRDYKSLKDLSEMDDVSEYGREAYPMAIRRMAETLKRICDEIDEVFEGKKPTQCLTDASWGKDMHFNGLLTDGVKKVNFLSFGAGGWNIQRFHYRFKITELKR